jgi:Flp pilus assembly CpaE family ATPase
MAIQFATRRDLRAKNLRPTTVALKLPALPRRRQIDLVPLAGRHDTRIARSAALSMAEKLIIVNGAKGGAGTTTVAVHLAMQLGHLAGKRIALLEFARPFGEISLRLDFSPRFTLRDPLAGVNRLDAGLLASMLTRHKSRIEILAGGLHAAMRAEQLQSNTIEALLRVLELACAAFDMVVVDLAFVTAAEWAAVLKMADSLLPSTEPTELAVGMLNRCLDAVRSSGIIALIFRLGSITRTAARKTPSPQRTRTQKKRSLRACPTISVKSAKR